MFQRPAARGCDVSQRCPGNGLLMPAIQGLFLESNRRRQTQALELHVDVSADAQQRQQETHAQQETLVHPLPVGTLQSHLTTRSLFSRVRLHPDSAIHFVLLDIHADNIKGVMTWSYDP